MHNKNFEIMIYICFAVVLGILYLSCANYSDKGYGYPGYRGYHRHHSFWYIRHHNHYYGASNRESSVSGNRYSRRGLSGGK